MNISIDYSGITGLFTQAMQEGRNFLFEHEVYDLLRLSGAETPPKTRFIPTSAKASDAEILSMDGEKTVLKIVSPTIIHKTELGGVRIVPKTPEKVRSAIRRMVYDVPERYRAILEHTPESAPQQYRGLTGEALQAAIAGDIRGVLQVQFMPPDSESFGNELIVGLRHTREFGMVLSAGLGGTDTELYAERFRKGQAIVAASTAMVDGEAFFRLFSTTISYKKLAGLTRGTRRIVTDEQLIECFESFIQMGNFYSGTNPHAPLYIDELEINPFAFTDFLMVPLDGLCRFSAPAPRPRMRPVHTIDKLLHPETIGIIGVSTTRKNFGHSILENILAAGFPKERVTVIKEGEETVLGVPCVPSLAALTQALDLFVVAIGAAGVPQLVDEIITRGAARAVMLIPGGIGETQDSHDMARRMMEKIEAAHSLPDGGPIFLGANCMGVVSQPGSYDTWFIPKEKFPPLPKQRHRAALISQSGAFMLNRISQCPELAPAYMISMGNQTDLTLGDMLQYFTNSPEVDVIAVYAEGFKDGDGLVFARATREAVLAGKQVLFYKAGRTPEGKSATSGHTASLAGDYMVCESCVREAGAIVARNFSEFQQVFFLAEVFASLPVTGRNIGAASGAGFEAVGMADSLQSDEYSMSLGVLGDATRNQLAELFRRKKIDSLVTIHNPLDMTPGADDETHVEAARLMLEDPAVHALVLGLDPLSPMVHSLDRAENPDFDLRRPDGIAARVIALRQQATKPFVTVVDGGRLYDPMRDMLRAHSIPVFYSCDSAVAALSLYMESRLYADALRAGAR